MEYNRQQSGGKNSGYFAKFLRTHPLDEDRIRQLLQLWLPEAEAEFARSSLR